MLSRLFRRDVQFAICTASKLLAKFGLFLASAAVLLAQNPTAVPVLTWRYDLTHAGANTEETALTPQNVNVNSFGKLFSLSVDSTVYAQPLYVPGLTMSDGVVHNVLFVATENDSIYAFDADSNGGANASPIWQISLLTAAYGAGAGATPQPPDSTGEGDIGPGIGITGTPAINTATNTMYVVAATEESGAYYMRLHAINIITGAEQSGSPVNITATVAGTGHGSSGGQITFSALWENQRPALDYYNGYVYVGFAAHGDLGPWHGWLFAYNATTLQQSAALCLSPDSYGAGIWAAGAGLPIDDDATGGRMFVVTGNGDLSTYPPFSASSDLGESVLDINLANGGLTPTDAFTPYLYQTLNDHDWDEGSGGILMVPDQQGAYPHILVTGGKEGEILVLNRDKLGGNLSTASSNSTALQDIPACPPTTNSADSTCNADFSTGLTPQGEGYWNTPAYWNGNVYIWPEFGSPMELTMNSGVMSTTPSSIDSGITSSFPSPSFSVSSNGAQDGIAWAVESDQFNTDGPAVLYAWDATDLSTPIYESDTNATRDSAGPANKFSIPVVTNGKVYVAAQGEVDVYGLLNGATTAAAPTITPDGGTFGAAQTVTLSTATASAAIYYTLDGSTPTTASTQYTGPITVNLDTTLNAIASATGYLQSAVSSATFTFTYQTPLPAFTPPAGTYLNAQNVAISDSDAKATIYYTTNGSAPSASSTPYTGPIPVSASETVEAIAIDPSLQNSNVVSAAYVIQQGGTTINFANGFSSTAGLTLNGSAVASDDSRMQLTDGDLWQAGSAFWNAPINIQSFTTTFEFQLSYAQGNGFTFTIQNVGPTALGGDSAGLGYQNIQNSVAVKFNFYNYEGEGSDSTGIYTDGEPPVLPSTDISSSGIELGSGDGIQATITYNGATLTLNLLDLVTKDTFTTSWPINIPQVVGGDTAYVGFTGGTGGLTASQKILNWTYATQASTQSTAPNPDFALSSSAANAISPGGSATSQITITPSGGFTGSVSLACAVTSSPSNAIDPPTCAITQPAAISGTQPATATLTINTTAPSAAALHRPLQRQFTFGGGATLAALFFIWLPIRRRKWQTLIGILLLVALASAASGCGSTTGASLKASGSGSNSGTTAGNYVVTVTGSSGSSQATTTIAVTVQ